MRVGYLIHDLSDSAAERRIKMLRIGGAQLSLAGFRRTEDPVPSVAGLDALDLGRTYDADLMQRAFKTAEWLLKSGRLAQAFTGVDTILARNLETLILAVHVRKRLKGNPRVIYECLDIHRSMVADNRRAKFLRAVERNLLDNVEAVVVSSPAFLDRYFEPIQGLGGEGEPATILVENKVLEADYAHAIMDEHRPPGPPWRILWPGIIRCRKSLKVLQRLTERMPGQIEVVIRGRPTTAVFPDLAAEVKDIPGVIFEGSFEDEELPGLYASTHFTWAIDYFDEGLNSSWLLPNRLYQGGYFASVPFALGHVEIGRWLKRNGLGMVFDDAEEQLEGFFHDLTVDRYRQLETLSRQAPRSLFCSDDRSCEELVQAISS